MHSPFRWVIVVGLIATLALIAPARAAQPMTDLDAWNAAKLMGVGVNIGNTLDNTAAWETGWGNPRITRKYIESLAALGFKTVRLPVAWDTYAREGRIQPDKLARVSEVVDWITAAGMFCVVNIHWDGGWIDSSQRARFPDTYATFSAAAERKYRSYWSQIADYLAGKNEHLLFEALNEETNFEGTGSSVDAYATLTRVNQLFIDTVRKTGGNNAKRLLIITGYSTDISKTTNGEYVLPTDTVPHKLLISVHYYTPWQFAGMAENIGLRKMQPTWGSPHDVAELNRLFDTMQVFCEHNDLPAFIGEFGVTVKKETDSRVRWMSAVAQAALSRSMVPVLWETGGDISRQPPHSPSPALRQVMQKLNGNKQGAAGVSGSANYVAATILGWDLMNIYRWIISIRCLVFGTDGRHHQNGLRNIAREVLRRCAAGVSTGARLSQLKLADDAEVDRT